MSDYQLIAEGRHNAVCRVIQFGSTTKGDPQVAIGFEIFAVEGETNPDAGRPITYFGQFTDAAEGKKKGSYDFTMDALRNIGWTGDDLSELPALAEADQLNKAVSLVVKHEEYDGQLKAKVSWVNRPGGGAVKLERPMDAQSLKSFAASMKSKIRGSSVTTQGAKPGPPPRNGNGGQRQAPHPNAPDSDIPFITSSVDAEQSPIARCIR